MTLIHFYDELTYFYDNIEIVNILKKKISRSIACKP